MLTEYDLALRRQRRNDFLATLAVTTGSAYASGNILGGLITIDYSNGVHGPISEASLSAILQSLVAVDPDLQSQAMDLFFFNQAPATAMTDKTNFAPSVADLQNCIGVVHIAAGDYVTSSLGSVAGGANQSNIGRVLKPGAAASKALYCVAVSRGTPTFTKGNFYIRFQFSNGL